MHYFITQIKKNQIIDKFSVHHISHVLRLKTWDRFYVIDWLWSKTEVEIINVQKKSIQVSIINNEKIEKWYKTTIRLFQVMPKSKSKWEFILQKASVFVHVCNMNVIFEVLEFEIQDTVNLVLIPVFNSKQ